MQELKSALAIYEQKLVFVILIPEMCKDKAVRKKILPIPNSRYEEININITDVIIFNNKTYQDSKEIYKNKLKPVSKCISNLLKKNYDDCSKRLNEISNVIELDIGILLLTNVKKSKLKNDCNNIEYELNGNYLITFNNCTVEIDHITFSNKQTIYKQNIILPNYDIMQNINKTVNIKDLDIRQMLNNKQIKEIIFTGKKKDTLTYINIIISTITISTVILIISFFIYKVKKLKSKIELIDKTKIAQESNNLNKGGVTYVTDDPLDKAISFIHVS